MRFVLIEIFIELLICILSISFVGISVDSSKCCCDAAIPISESYSWGVFPFLEYLLRISFMSALDFEDLILPVSLSSILTCFGRLQRATSRADAVLQFFLFGIRDPLIRFSLSRDSSGSFNCLRVALPEKPRVLALSLSPRSAVIKWQIWLACMNVVFKMLAIRWSSETSRERFVSPKRSWFVR